MRTQNGEPAKTFSIENTISINLTKQSLKKYKVSLQLYYIANYFIVN